MEVLVLKLNGWPALFDERIDALSDAVDHLVLIRPCPSEDTADFDCADVDVYNLYPKRGAYIPPKAHGILLPLYVVQAIILGIGLLLTRRAKPDTIHALDYVLGGMSGAVLSTLFDIPFVLSVRGLMEPRYREIVRNNPGPIVKFNYWVLTKVTGLIFPRADHIITKASYQQEYLRDSFGVDVEMTTIPTGVDFDTFDCQNLDSDVDIEEVLPAGSTLLSEQYTTFLYLGKIIPEKGVGDLVDLVAATDSNLPDDIRFEIIGDVRDPEFERTLRRKIDGLADRVIFSPGAIPFASVPHVLCAADGVVLLSTPQHEGTPRILQEACATQTPLIASDVTGIRGAFEGFDGCELIDPTDENAFESAVRTIREGVEMERDVFRDEFDLYANYRSYRSVYDLVSEARRRS